jgi:hypothetical protein
MSEGRDPLMTCVIAMQKVEGSNPFSRFSRNPALGRDFVVYGGAKGKWGLTPIPPDSASLCASAGATVAAT